MMLDERYDHWDDYYEDDYDEDYEDNNSDDIEFEAVRLIEKIQHTRKVYDMTPVDRIVLDILEEVLELL